MKTIQKLTLGLLTVVASSAGFASNLIIDVTSGSAEVSGAIAGTASKIGAGVAVLSGNNASLTALNIQAGEVEINAVNAMPQAVTFSTAANNILEVTVDGASVPALTMTLAGKLLCTNDTTLAGAPSGAALTVDAAANKVLTIGADLSAGTSAMVIASAATVAVGAASGDKMPAASAPAVTVAGILELKSAMAGGYCAGVNVINGILQVDNSVTVPAFAAATNSTNTDFFNHWNGSASEGSLKFNSGATLKLGSGATWARAITVGTAL